MCETRSCARRSNAGVLREVLERTTRDGVNRMPTITSGTTTERIVRNALVMLLVDGFTVAYVWDGYVGYARQNAAELARVVGMGTASSLASNPRMTTAEGRRIAAETQPGAKLDDITSALGAPTVTKDEEVYFLGPGGWLRLRLEKGAIVSAVWTDGKRSESDQKWQRGIGFVLAIVGVVLTVQLARVVSTRATLSDAGLQVSGRPLIPFEAMTGLRVPGGGKGGRVELEYSLDGRRGVIHLDEYVFREAPAIAAAIRERKAFPGPRG